MSDEKKAAQATPNATLEQQVMSACIAKSEREWWAKHRIDALAAELAVAKKALQAGRTLVSRSLRPSRNQ